MDRHAWPTFQRFALAHEAGAVMKRARWHVRVLSGLLMRAGAALLDLAITIDPIEAPPGMARRIERRLRAEARAILDRDTWKDTV